MSQSPGPGWWLASDGKWYPPHLHPDARRPAPAQAERRAAEPQLSPRDTIPAPLGDPNAPLPRRQPGGATEPVTDPPTTVPASPATSPVSPTSAPVQPPATEQVPPQPDPGPAQPPPAAPAPEPLSAAATAPPATPGDTTPSPKAGSGDTRPVVRWNNEQQRQPVDSGPSSRGLSTQTDADADPSRLIPLPDLDAEPPPEAPRITNKAPTLADTLLGARATTPEAALPATRRDTDAPAATEPPQSATAATPTATEPPQAERWERPDRDPFDETTPAAPAAVGSGAAVASTIGSASATDAVPDIAESGDSAFFETDAAPEEEATRDDSDRRGARLVNVGVIALAVVLAAGAAFFLLRDDGSGGEEADGASNLRAVTALRVGDCFGGELLGEAEIEQVPIVDCSMPHQYQVFHSTEFEPADASFDPEAIRQQATVSCSERLEAMLGVPLAESQVQLLLLNPTDESWSDEQDRTSLCLAYDPQGPLRAPIGS